MIRLILVMLTLVLICSGCGKEEPTPAQEQVESSAPESPAPETNVQSERESKGYFDILLDAKKQAKDLVALEPARQCVEAFKALEGRLPKDLDELKAAGIAPPNPPAGKKWIYDPETGEINLAPATE